MKRFCSVPHIIVLLVTLACGLAAVPVGAQSGHGAGQAAGSPAQADIAAAPECPICGMDRGKFAHSRFYTTYEDGSTYGTCSLHCAAIDLALKLGVGPGSLQVGDYGSRELIDATAATWVLGGSQPGVMTRRAKWAFGTPEAAKAFVDQFGGQITDFETAVKGAYEDMYEDTRMIRQKRKQMQHKQHGG